MPKPTKPKMLCSQEGCERPAKKRHLCAECAAEGYYAKCTVEGCNGELFAKGRCKPHWMRWWRKKKGDKAPPASAPVRVYGKKRVVVFTRIPEDVANVIVKAAGSKAKLYTQVQNILTEWAAAQG